jgi:hypothetical protein
MITMSMFSEGVHEDWHMSCMSWKNGVLDWRDVGSERQVRRV